MKEIAPIFLMTLKVSLFTTGRVWMLLMLPVRRVQRQFTLLRGIGVLLVKNQTLLRAQTSSQSILILRLKTQ